MSKKTTGQQRRAEVDKAIAERGLRVVPLGSNGAVRVYGQGTDILLADWRALTVLDLRPVLA